jgi:glycosyltransferase involved in cell wall biosynthesis
MKVAFYAPLKPPDHPVPSGDRQLARALLLALRAGGHATSVASRFRSFDRHGDALRQARIADLGERLAQRLIARYRRQAEPPDVWFTYHLYHKAPDFLGPRVSRALGIAYVVAEASVAAAQRGGPWAQGYAASVAGIEAATAALVLNPADIAGVRNVRGADAITDVLPPFLDLAAFTRSSTPVAREAAPPSARVRLITVAMMREGNKLASYQLLAAALAKIASFDWDLVVVGDGAGRPAVEAAFVGIDPRRLRFVGAQSPDRVASLLHQSDLFLWPAIDEVLGMVFVEAQACGLPVVGGHTRGVASVVAADRTGILVPPGDADAFAAATQSLLIDAAMRERMGREAVAYVRARHDLPAAAARIDAILRRVVTNRATTGAGECVAAPAR